MSSAYTLDTNVRQLLTNGRKKPTMVQNLGPGKVFFGTNSATTGRMVLAPNFGITLDEDANWFFSTDIEPTTIVVEDMLGEVYQIG